MRIFHTVRTNSHEYITKRICHHIIFLSFLVQANSSHIRSEKQYDTDRQSLTSCFHPYHGTQRCMDLRVGIGSHAFHTRISLTRCFLYPWVVPVLAGVPV